LPTFTVCYCQASIESADGSLVGSPGKSIQWSSLSDDDDAVFAFTTTLSMTSAEDYLRVEIIGIEASRQAQLHAAGDTQGAQDAAAVHGDDKDKAPAKRAPLCGFRVLLSTLGNTEGNGSQWYKLAAPEDIVESGAVVIAGGNDETSHGKVLIETKQIWNKKSMRSRLFGVMNS
jgi:hypothetical protein